MTERLVLRALTEDDLEAVFQVLTDEIATANVSWRQRSREDTKAWLGRRMDNERVHGASLWAIEDRESGEMLGLSGFFPRDDKLELGYVVRSRFWRRGFATEAVTAAVQRATDAGRHVYATIRPKNCASVRVAENAGLKLVDKTEDTRGELLIYARP